AVNANLDRLVSYNALFFVPLGAVVLVDVWLFPKMGLISNFTEKSRKLFSWPSALAWAGSFLICFFIYGKDHLPCMQSLFGKGQPAWLAAINMDLTYLIAPEWLLASAMYVVFSYVQQKGKRNVDQIRKEALS
ncbi:MAG: hypothetical protein ACK5JD_08040, partial [Mangrovibacterium sp.]